MNDGIADVQVYLLGFATKLDVNILGAAEQKVVENSAKYPVDLVNGSTKKHTEYQRDENDTGKIS